MKTLHTFLAAALLALTLTSCYSEVIIEEDPIVVDPTPAITLGELLSSYELWYVDVNRSSGSGYIPFVQKAFTLSFQGGTVFANNNLVGIGDQGYGYGIDVGFYDTFDFVLDISHDIDGVHSFDVVQVNNHEIDLYYPPQNLRYRLVGYQRTTFDYDALFYDNIHYFLQEYTAWEKSYTSATGEVNEFDYEQFLQFLPGGGDGNFRSSQDPNGTPINDLYWDYTGIYNVDPVPGDFYTKYLTLDYDYLGNEFFELNVINDSTIELFHESSGTVYRFRGKGYIPFKSPKEGKLRLSTEAIEKEMIKISTF
ncbi:nicotinic acid mononucleotide adenyltransferase [Altibacter sp. HG106]|uniref:nicotinic acid mononucleotide adenyltransferase n=1 Tax=Altibacter sp. HG106 TaxID=3023937 RepID=UPI002350217F|nr:nicotinic acid mononucleotide adenyltransferase [Altibacter sp. HG106]MDC7994862.1 nicotinic acid mononucleotide adenyltransferase [Altibacter sp. HG106]